MVLFYLLFYYWCITIIFILDLKMKTISEIIKNYNNQQIHNYYLNGDDVFLEKFFINQMVYRFLNKDGSKILYHFGVDREDSFLNLK